MSFIQFENAREKEKLRQDLREARQQMLEKAKKRSEQRADLEARKLLAGESNWMLPSVKNKLKKNSKDLRGKSKKHKKANKKLKKKSHKKRINFTSENESTSSNTDSSPSDQPTSKKSKKLKKKSHKKRINFTSDNESTSSNTDSSQSDQSTSKKSKKIEKSVKHSKKAKETKNNTNSTDDSSNKEHTTKKLEEPLKRDCWMTGALMLKTYSKERVDNRPKDSQANTYDPVKSSRELNPYWKTTGTGLPQFQKPREDDSANKIDKSVYENKFNCTKGWRRKCHTATSEICLQQQKESSYVQCVDTSESESDVRTKRSEFLTDKQMNELSAKIFKAEIIGNAELASKLREKLEKARSQRINIKEQQKIVSLEGSKCNLKTNKDANEEHIILMHTDKLGNTRPLPKERAEAKDLYIGKKKKKMANSYEESGKRVRYFADDDRYDIKQMFEKEKYTSALEANLKFATVAGKGENSNEDLEDIFAEKICQDDSERSDKNELSKAIRDHKKMTAALDKCDKCFDSTKLQKELLVCVGENVYLALPWYRGLQSGHCMIIPNEHSSCCTLIDENTWAEINEFRKALTCMFAAQNKDVIFFEIANKLHRQPHLSVHCIPIQHSDGELAPFYFKKAIEESEHDWCVNKQLVSLRDKSLRSSIPKGLPYFWVNFGMDSGYAHVIEDEERFPSNFAQEIIGGMLNLDANMWRRPQKEQNVITKVKTFADWWKKYDCTI